MPITKTKISYTLDLEEMMEEFEIKKSKRKDAAEAVGLMLIDSIASETQGQRSPVEGGSYKKGLSKPYEAFKRKKGKGTLANLELTGDMLGSLGLAATKKDITIKMIDSANNRKSLNVQKKKAFNHNTGDTLPPRQFLPDDTRNQVFKEKITNRIKDVLKGFDGES